MGVPASLTITFCRTPDRLFRPWCVFFEGDEAGTRNLSSSLCIFRLPLFFSATSGMLLFRWKPHDALRPAPSSSGFNPAGTEYHVMPVWFSWRFIVLFHLFLVLTPSLA